jgi:glycosyltransferase involved in cell wall biosynthesis
MTQQARLAFVVQRYGDMLTGGAERLCRHVAEHLADAYDIDVLTTTARDCTSWSNYYVPGRERVGPMSVRRFAVEAGRGRRGLRWRTRLLFGLPHSDRQEARWIESQGPYCPSMIDYIAKNRDEYDLFFFFSYRSYPSFAGLSIAPRKSVLVPVAEDDDAIYLRAYRTLFAQPRGILYVSPEEKALIERVADNPSIPNATVGIGIDAPEGVSCEPALEKYMLTQPYVLYVGRIDESKGCPALFENMIRFFAEHPDSPYLLVLAGSRAMPIPRHPRIHDLGYVPEADKFGLIAGCQMMLMPSRCESLSIVTLEGMAMGKPLLVNAQCAVLLGHARRSGGAIAVASYEELASQLLRLHADPALRDAIGERGRAYVREQYRWSDVVREYRRFIRQMLGHSAEKMAEMHSEGRSG